MQKIAVFFLLIFLPIPGSMFSLTCASVAPPGIRPAPQQQQGILRLSSAASASAGPASASATASFRLAPTLGRQPPQGGSRNPPPPRRIGSLPRSATMGEMPSRAAAAATPQVEWVARWAGIK